MAERGLAADLAVWARAAAAMLAEVAPERSLELLERWRALGLEVEDPEGAAPFDPAAVLEEHGISPESIVYWRGPADPAAEIPTSAAAFEALRAAVAAEARAVPIADDLRAWAEAARYRAAAAMEAVGSAERRLRLALRHGR